MHRIWPDATNNRRMRCLPLQLCQWRDAPRSSVEWLRMDVLCLRPRTRPAVSDVLHLPSWADSVFAAGLPGIGKGNYSRDGRGKRFTRSNFHHRLQRLRTGPRHTDPVSR